MNPHFTQTQLEVAEKAVCSILHQNFLGSNLVTHLERALAHVREAHVVLIDSDGARSIPKLLEDLQKGEALLQMAAKLSLRGNDAPVPCVPSEHKDSVIK